MAKVIGVTLAAMLALPLTAAAQEDLRIDQSKIYVTDPAACDMLEKKGIEAFMDLDFLALGFPKGIQSMEFQCNFFDVKSREGSTHLFVNAVCEALGELYPDTMAIAPYSETQIQLVSSYDAAMTLAGIFEPTSAVATPGATLYTRCDNLSEITVD